MRWDDCDKIFKDDGSVGPNLQPICLRNNMVCPWRKERLCICERMCIWTERFCLDFEPVEKQVGILFIQIIFQSWVEVWFQFRWINVLISSIFLDNVKGILDGSDQIIIWTNDVYQISFGCNIELLLLSPLVIYHKLHYIHAIFPSIYLNRMSNDFQNGCTQVIYGGITLLYYDIAHYTRSVQFKCMHDNERCTYMFYLTFTSHFLCNLIHLQ